VGLRAGEEEGVVTTKPIAFGRGGGAMPTRGRLYLNVNAKGGRTFVEFCDLRGDPIPGFAWEDCDPIEVDSTAVRVTWNGNPVTAKVLGVPVVIRFYLRDATIYSMGFRRTGDPSDPFEKTIMEMEAEYRSAPLGEREKIRDRMVEYLSNPRAHG
jgi:hypothetical protein